MAKPVDDAAARARRARALRKRMEEVISGKAPPGSPESPRDFVERRMRELAAERARRGRKTK